MDWSFWSEESDVQNIVATDINPIFVQGEIVGYTIIFNKNASTAESFTTKTFNLPIRREVSELDKAFSGIIGRSEN